MKLRNLLLITYTLISLLVISRTVKSEALINDAQSYYDLANHMHANKTIFQTFFSNSSQFIDHGYPTVLAISMNLFGSDNIISFQILNYLFWASSAFVIYKSLQILESKKAKLASILMLFSPLYLTFSSKLYSEPFASLGISLLIYGFASAFKKPSLFGQIAMMGGGIIFYSTKSVFLPSLLLLAIYLGYRRFWKYLLSMFIVMVIIAPSVVGSMSGGRSLYTLNIQSSKVDQSYDQILSCIPYYLSYPIGKSLLPSYEGVCHQNDASREMPGYESNPYVIADLKRAAGWNYEDWIKQLIKDPFKYLLIMFVSLSNIILFEGVYPSIILQFPLWAMIITFVVTKIVLSIYLWEKAILASKKSLLLIFPLIYFALVVTHFPVEPRYFYPLIPFMYFLIGI